MATFDPPPNTSTTNRLLFTASKTISVATLHDNDAENESFGLSFSMGTSDVSNLFRIADADAEGGDATITLAAPGRYNPVALIIDDDETQEYKLTFSNPGENVKTPTEGVEFTVDLTASPAHDDGMGSLTVNLDKQKGWTMELHRRRTDTSTTLSLSNVIVDGDTNAKRSLYIKQADGDGNRGD